MQLEVGKIVEGKVTGITKFGAFVEMEGNKVGMVHISEVSDTYVNDISEHLTDGQSVKVKILSINDDGKISLSIKKAMKPKPQQENASGQNFVKREFKPNPNRQNNNRPNNSFNRDDRGMQNRTASKPANSFEDMLNKFMQTSDEKISDIKKTREVSRKGGSRRPK